MKHEITKEMRDNGVRWWLASWGNYLRNHGYEYLGYPKKSHFIDGPGVIRATSETETMPEPVEKIDRIVNAPAFDQLHRFALRCRYVSCLSGFGVQNCYGIEKRRFNRIARKAEREVEKLLEV